LLVNLNNSTAIRRCAAPLSHYRPDIGAGQTIPQDELTGLDLAPRLRLGVNQSPYHSTAFDRNRNFLMDIVPQKPTPDCFAVNGPSGGCRRPLLVIALSIAACFLRTSSTSAQVTQPLIPAAADKPDAKPTTADQKSDPVRDALGRIRTLSLADFLDWLRLHGVSVVVIMLAMSGILWLANRLQKRLVELLARHTTRGTPAEQENRARTLVGVLLNALRSLTIATGAIMILEEIGVPIGPLVGSVAVVGLAVAFGAQSLIKDYFTGFLVLLEQQYMIGDVVRISSITGQVERITMRVTVLRDLEGAVHFIPHGQINLVSNLTHGWSQAVFDLNVPVSEPVERVRDLFYALASDLRGDATFGPMILNDAELLGVDSLSETTCTLKFVLRTLPLKRWEVKRELLRRIKERFQREQIKVTVPA
jgi:small-conductance mechanosensitive channel